MSEVNLTALVCFKCRYACYQYFFSQEHAKKHTMKSSMKIKRQVEEMMLIKGSLKRLLNLKEKHSLEKDNSLVATMNTPQ